MAVALSASLAPWLGAQSISVVRGIDFGTILTGVTTSIDPRGIGAMEFDISGPLGSAGGWSLTLPTVLTRVGGGATMPITFCSTCAVFRIANNNPAGGVTFDPAYDVRTLTVLSPLHVYVWIGGSVSPPLQQMAGSYTGTIVITLAPII